MYRVLKYFTDLQDNKHPYHEGDIFPRDGLKVSRERLEELSGSKNKQGKPLIKKVEEDNFSNAMNPPVVEETKVYTKTEINRMSTAELQALAKNQGIENAENITGGELKKILIEKFEL